MSKRVEILQTNIQGSTIFVYLPNSMEYVILFGYSAAVVVRVSTRNIFMSMYCHVDRSMILVLFPPPHFLFVCLAVFILPFNGNGVP